MYQRCGCRVIKYISVTLPDPLALYCIATNMPLHPARNPACGCQENCDEGEDRGSRKEVGCQSAGCRGLRPETDETRRGKPRVCPNEHRPYPAGSPRRQFGETRRG